MSHEISDVGFGAEMYSGAGKTPWHRLGTVIEGVATAEEALGLAKLDWLVEQRELKMFDPAADGEFVIPDKVANVRKDAEGNDVYLGTVGKGYSILQNRDAFGILDAVLANGQAFVETAGALREGRRVWVLCRLPEDFTVGNEDTIRQYFLLTTAHDGTQACRMLLTPVRVVCNNTLTCALQMGADDGIAIKHSGDMEQKVSIAAGLLAKARDYYGNLQKVFDGFLRTRLNEREARAYFRTVYPKPTDKGKTGRSKTIWDGRQSDLWRNYNRGRGAELSRGTVWGAYNAVTEFVDHTQYEDSKRDKGEGRMASLLWGAGKQVKEQAFTLAESLVSVSMN